MKPGTESSASETGRKILLDQPLEISLFVKLFARCRAPASEEKQEIIIASLLVDGTPFDFQDMVSTIRGAMKTPKFLIEAWLQSHHSREARAFVARLRRHMDDELLWKVLQEYGKSHQGTP